MTIGWGSNEPTQLFPMEQQLQLFVDPDAVSSTYAPGTIYSINETEYALTLEQDETTVTYFVIKKNASDTATHEEFNAMIRPDE